MEKIAFLLKDFNEIGSFQNCRELTVYGKERHWGIFKSIPINISAISRVNTIREYYRAIVEELDDCKVIVVEKAQGVPYGVFYEADFSIWELSGNPEDYLDTILEKEEEHIKEVKELESKSVAKKIQDGYYVIDLNELQFTRPELSSKKAIMPFLEHEKFDILEVRCCHIPPWLEKKEYNKEISISASKIKRNEYKVLIKKLT